MVKNGYKPEQNILGNFENSNIIIVTPKEKFGQVDVEG